MLFNSLPFLAFFPIVCCIYWAMGKGLTKYRNLLLLVASYYFYMSWEPVYAILILFTSLSTWYCGLRLSLAKSHQRRYITLCLSVNLIILFFFKYYNFTVDSVLGLLQWSCIRLEIPHSDFLLPVGISFYTFQSIGYIIDVYRKEIAPEKNFFTYALFISFFPQLVAGPIERAKNLLPQFNSIHSFNGEEFIEGLKLMIWGFFMKLCVAGNVAPYVDAVYNNLPNHNGSSMLLASVFFSFQIFCDFGGYSLIAIGTARCLGFRLKQNFNHPYLSLSVKDFWRRWHISLSSWFGSYVYIPLGGNRCKPWRHKCNLMLTMLASGLWHGANWTFVWWGGIHGLFLVINSMYQKLMGKRRLFPKCLSVVCTAAVVTFVWIFFRANSLSDAFTVISGILTQPGRLYEGEGMPSLLITAFMIMILMVKEIKDEFHLRLSLMHNSSPWVSIFYTAALLVIILLCAEFNSGKFIYFQF